MKTYSMQGRKVMRCSAYCTATSIDTFRFYEYVRSKYTARRYREVIYVTIDKADIFFFPYASTVFWGLTAEAETEMLNELKYFEYQVFPKICEDHFSYETGSALAIDDDRIVLPDDSVLTKLACSHAIAQSAKIDSFEQTIQKTIDMTKELPETLAGEGKISLSGKQIRKMMGRLFIDRHSINLHQELLDTPEFFWEHTELEPIYSFTSHYLDRERRVHVLNQRLTVIKELFDMLSNEVNHKHSSRLEWTIIWLIVIEVVLAFLTDVLHII